MSGIPRIDPYPMPTAADLPANVAAWQVDPARAVLLIHDMQRYFLKPFPAGSPREELLSNVHVLRERCAQAGMPVAWTAQPGSMSAAERGLLADFWGAGMAAVPSDREVVASLRPEPDDWWLTKWRYSAFFRSDLLDRMRAHGRDQLVLCGIYAHVGVLATAIEAFTHDIRTTLVADAVADFSADYHHLALQYAAQRCAVVSTAASVLGDLAAAASVLAGRPGGDAA
ncbi:isochorismatase family protein [Micromonospora sp. NPDC051196]|uniref:isochorismatase family protein n=1 Tax=Micromonospora sp. NPDC051196 TaxID=3155281 RepID=UPI003430087B